MLVNLFTKLADVRRMGASCKNSSECFSLSLEEKKVSPKTIEMNFFSRNLWSSKNYWCH